MSNLSVGQISVGLNLALAEARKAQRKHTYPIGAVLTTLDGELIAKAHNRVKSHHDPTAHAEVEVIRKAGAFLQKDKRQSVLYTTTEPCLMCMGAILAADIAVVVWGVSDAYGGAADFIADSYRRQNLVLPQLVREPLPELVGPICELMKSWDVSRGYSTEIWNRP